jgi:hypothetical protein
MSSIAGWLTTKKQGRDDKDIQAAKKTALEKKRAKRGLVAAKPKTTGSAKRNKKGFVADSESEESQFSIQDEHESEEEEDCVLSEEESSEDNANDSDDDDDDHDDDGRATTFMTVPKGKRTNFNVKPMMEESAKLKKKARANGYTAKAQPKVVDSDESWSGAESDLFPNRGKKPAAAAKKKKKIDIPLSSEEEIDSPLPLSTKGMKSKYFEPKAKPVHSLSSDDDDTPAKAKPTKEKAVGRKRVIAVDDDDDDADSKQNKSNGSDSLQANNSDADDAVDSDEAVAIVEAMKASLKDEKKSKMGTGKKRFQKFGQLRKPKVTRRRLRSTRMTA